MFFSKISKSLFLTFNKTLQFFRTHKELTIILFLTFMTRFYLADWNSYWLDELYSVYRLNFLSAGDQITFDNAIDFLRHRQTRPTSLPLYEFLLFNWMQLFGQSEVATRTLSNIYVTLATLFLFLFSVKTFNRRIAIASTLFFSFSYMAVFHSLESRYYAQMLFLSTLSSYLLYVYLSSLRTFSWRSLTVNKYFVLLSFVNVALMLTHPFNYLFIATQLSFLFLPPR